MRISRGNTYVAVHGGKRDTQVNTSMDPKTGEFRSISIFDTTGNPKEQPKQLIIFPEDNETRRQIIYALLTREELDWFTKMPYPTA
jgi:hypothetical protein